MRNLGDGARSRSDGLAGGGAGVKSSSSYAGGGGGAGARKAGSASAPNPSKSKRQSEDKTNQSLTMADAQTQPAWPRQNGLEEQTPQMQYVAAQTQMMPDLMRAQALVEVPVMTMHWTQSVEQHAQLSLKLFERSWAMQEHWMVWLVSNHLCMLTTRKKEEQSKRMESSSFVSDTLCPRRRCASAYPSH